MKCKHEWEWRDWRHETEHCLHCEAERWRVCERGGGCRYAYRYPSTRKTEGHDDA